MSARMKSSNRLFLIIIINIVYVTRDFHKEDKPLLEPRQVAGTFTFYGGERLAELVIRKPLQFPLRHESKADHRICPEGLLIGWNLLEDLPAGRQIKSKKNKSLELPGGAFGPF